VLAAGADRRHIDTMIRPLCLALVLGLGAALLGPAAVAPRPALAATAVGCTSAGAIIGFTQGSREIRVNLLRRISDPAAIEALLRAHGWDAALGRADAVQLHYAPPSRYLLMATARGCRVAHAFIDEAEARALQAE
jgi:hypothetical protein